MGEPVAQLPALGWDSLGLSFVSLAVVCVLAYLALRFLSSRGFGRGMGAVRVLARCPLEPRRSVYLIEAAGRCFLVGVGDGPMALLAEVDGTKVGADAAAGATPSPGRGKFADVLARVLGGRPAGAASAPAGEPGGAPARESPQ